MKVIQCINYIPDRNKINELAYKDNYEITAYRCKPLMKLNI